MGTKRENHSTLGQSVKLREVDTKMSKEESAAAEGAKVSEAKDEAIASQDASGQRNRRHEQSSSEEG